MNEVLHVKEVFGLQKSFDGVNELVRDVLGQRIKRIPQAALPNQFECGSTHPVENVELLGAILHSIADCNFELDGLSVIGHTGRRDRET